MTTTKSRSFLLVPVMSLLVAGCGLWRSTPRPEAEPAGARVEPAPETRAAAMAPAAKTARTVPFTVRVEDTQAKNAPALQSFGFAEHDGRWLMVGGRTNGFHRTSQPESTFPSKSNNEYLWAYDPAGDKSWKALLPQDSRNMLRSSNMEFYQDGDVLYVAGGYGSDCDSDEPSCYMTYAHLTALLVPQLIEVITTNGDVSPYIITLEDERFRVTGGGLSKLGEDFYLVFGQNYDNIYKGGYTGKYSNEIRRFRVDLDGSSLTVTDYQAYGDPTDIQPEASEYHRRDLNVVAAVRADQSPGLTVYGGVFTPEGGAWGHPMYIDNAGGSTRIKVDQSFEQKTNLYESAHLLMYDPGSRTMYTTLFGGISNYYYDSQGMLVPSSQLENWLPFVDLITTIAVASDGTTTEDVQPPEQALPALMGANAVFVPDPALARVSGSPEVLDWSRLPAGDSVLVGHIYGGILAIEPQASEFNPTYASDKVYEVYIDHAP